MEKLILIGEDDIDDQELLQELFSERAAEYKLHFASTGRRLLADIGEMASRQLPCLIILDYNMPELTGVEILRILKENRDYDPIPKVIWSSSRSDEYRKICLDSGANYYIVKPSNMAEMEETIKQLISFC